MTTFKAGDKVRRARNNEARIWQRHPVVTVRWVSGNNVCFHELRNTYIASYFEPVKEPVKLDPGKWDRRRIERAQNRFGTTGELELLGLWVLTELSREGCLAWFGNSAKPEPETVMVELPRSIVELWADSARKCPSRAKHYQTIGEAAIKALSDV